MMDRIIVFLVISFVLLSCNSNPKNKVVDTVPVMYEPSEMALLMRQMHEVNKVVKNQIISKDTLLPFPEEFLTIDSAILTDPSDRDIEFDSLAKQFMNHQKNTFLSNSDSIIYHFNKSINTCITCHESKCTGPIPKIKKLLIH